MAVVALVSAVAVSGCLDKEERASFEGTIDQDGYALFVVENGRQQRDEITVRVRDADPDATYVLFYSTSKPKSVGWFQFDPTTRSRCGGDLGPHCRVDDFGHMVDYVKVGRGQREVTLRDERCGCDSDRAHRSWDGYWSVMRVERTNRRNPVTVEVLARRIRDFADEPKIRQLD